MASNRAEINVSVVQGRGLVRVVVAVARIEVIVREAVVRCAESAVLPGVPVDGLDVVGDSGGGTVASASAS